MRKKNWFTISRNMLTVLRALRRSPKERTKFDGRTVNALFTRDLVKRHRRSDKITLTKRGEHAAHL